MVLTRCLLVGVLHIVSACQDCDPWECEELCREAYPVGEAELDACYAECAEEAEACRRD